MVCSGRHLRSFLSPTSLLSLTPQNPRVCRLCSQRVREIARNQQLRTRVSGVLTKSFPHRPSHENQNLKSRLRRRTTPQAASPIRCDRSTVLTFSRSAERCALLQSKFHQRERAPDDWLKSVGRNRTVRGAQMSIRESLPLLAIVLGIAAASPPPRVTRVLLEPRRAVTL